MSIKFLSRRMAAVGLTAMLLIGLTLTACGSAAESPDPQKPVESDQAAAEAQSEAVEGAEPPEEATPTEEVAPTEEAQATDNENLLAPEQPLPSTVEATAACNAVEIPENMLIAAVSDSDWSIGPENAPVTVIEYGDFQ